jgi:hypothetical protein
MADYTDVQRSGLVTAEPAIVLGYLSDFHRWPEWSPWEGLDPDLKRTYGGPGQGVGSTYAWSGNRKAGAGSMRVTAATAERVAIDLQFTRPFRSASLVEFALRETDDGTAITWTMRTPKTLMTRFFGIFMNMERAIGDDLARGLAQLQQVAGR